MFNHFHSWKFFKKPSAKLKEKDQTSSQKALKTKSFISFLHFTTSSKMTPLMHGMCSLTGKTRWAKFTFVRLLSSVNIIVIFKPFLFHKAFTALVTLESFMIVRSMRWLYNKVIYERVLATDWVRLHLCTHSMARANLNKSIWLVTNTTTASNYIPRRTRMCINWNPAFQTQIYLIKVL